MNTKKRIFTPGTIYLLVLLALVLLYAVFAVPPLRRGLLVFDGRCAELNAQISVLSPLSAQHAQLSEKTAQAQQAYETNATLLLPAQFTNAINKAADTAGVQLNSIAVEDHGETALADGSKGASATATVVVEIAPGDTPVSFLKALESCTGAGFYVDSLQFQPGGRTPEQGSAAAPPAGDAAAAEEVVPARLTVQLTCYTLPK